MLLTHEVLIFFGILMCLFGLLFTSFRVDGIAITTLVLLGLAQLIPQTDLFSGFASLPVIALLSIMILSKGLEKTGLINWWANQLVQISGENPQWIYLLFLISAGLLAAVIQNFGAVAMLLPAASLIALRVQIPLQKLLIPMCFCAILGSNLTMTGSSPMLLLSAYRHFPLFAPWPIGLIGLLFGIAYFWIRKDRLFPTQTNALEHNLKAHYLSFYGLDTTQHEVHLPADSPWIDWSIGQLESILPEDIILLAATKGHNVQLPARRKSKITSHTKLALMGPLSVVQAWCAEHHLIWVTGLPTFSDVLNPSASGLCEAVIPPASSLVSAHYKELHFRREQAIQLLAILRGKGIRKGKKIRKTRLKPGDALLIYGLWHRMRAFQKQKSLIWISGSIPKLYDLSPRWPLALLSLLVSCLLVLFLGLSIGFALFVGATCMVTFRLLSLDEAYAAIHWRTIFVLASLMPLGQAALSTGTARYCAQWVQSITHDWHQLPILLLLGALSTLLSQLISNVGSTILLLPFAHELATQLHQPPLLYMLLVSLSANNVFSLPTHQANNLIMGSGQYSNKDFLKAGIPIAAFFWLFTVGMVYWGSKWFPI